MGRTLEDLKADIALFNEELRQDRIERGLPSERPADFVGIPLSIVIADRLKPFLPIAVRYAAILAEGTLYRMDPTKLEGYRRDAELLCKSTGLWSGFVGGGYRAILQVIDKVNEADQELPADALRQLHYNIELARGNARSDADGSKEVLAEVERLMNDPAAFQAEYSAALAHYESIKHLL
ncbi:hypothetical protein J2T17_004696 [Paenibacillus mucilaginosus]|uniref:hypothetical protein n=1 Tax=Paenibacillus mucilaginosus TaxID=61624 RepID=UPI003D1EFBC2